MLRLLKVKKKLMFFRKQKQQTKTKKQIISKPEL